TYFDIILILTDGGPGNATRILPMHMYATGFSSFDMGYASVLAVLLLVAGTVLSLLIVTVTGLRRMTSQREGLCAPRPPRRPDAVPAPRPRPAGWSSGGAR